MQPALAEFTEKYPAWDLSTIFDYINRGKLKEPLATKKKRREIKAAQKLQESKIKNI